MRDEPGFARGLGQGSKPLPQLNLSLKSRASLALLCLFLLSSHV